MELASFDSFEEVNALRTLKARHSSVFADFTCVGGMANTAKSTHDWFWMNSGEKVPFTIS
jgi:hypothetical protein